jgi:pSer/pThr/pTyr-binding forkhead associated (FHA) protein
MPPQSSSPITSLRLILSGSEVVLGLGEHVLGRSADCAVMVDDPLTSRRHAAINVCATSVTVRDLGSRNGVLVNGEEIEHVRILVEGDLITIGSQALTVLQIGRATTSQGMELATSGPGRQASRSSILGKIQVIRRAVPEEKALSDALNAATTLGHTTSPFGRPAAAFHLIAEAAARAVTAGRPERAEKILEAPLTEVLATVRAGLDVEDEVVDIVVEQAILLCAITRQQRWFDYVHDLHDKLHRRLPTALAERLALLAQPVR